MRPRYVFERVDELVELGTGDLLAALDALELLVDVRLRVDAELRELGEELCRVDHDHVGVAVEQARHMPEDFYDVVLALLDLRLGLLRHDHLEQVHHIVARSPALLRQPGLPRPGR